MSYITFPSLCPVLSESRQFGFFRSSVECRGRDSCFLCSILHLNKRILVSSVSIYTYTGTFRCISRNLLSPFNSHSGCTSAKRRHGNQNHILLVDFTPGKRGFGVAQIDLDGSVAPALAENAGNLFGSACGAEK